MKVAFRDLGRIDYKAAWDLQETLLSENVSAKTQARKTDRSYPAKSIATLHHLLFCEHQPVFTMGKSGDMANILISEEEMRDRGIAFSGPTGAVISLFMDRGRWLVIRYLTWKSIILISAATCAIWKM